jgi:putative transposase
VKRLAKAHQMVPRQRQDFHHKTARSLLRQYDTISCEDVQIAPMLRNHHLAKSISDAGWASCRAIREATAACAGRRGIAVPPAAPAPDWSGGRARIPKSLRVRTPVGTACGLVMDRDENAAQTMLRAGQALRGAVA